MEAYCTDILMKSPGIMLRHILINTYIDLSLSGLGQNPIDKGYVFTNDTGLLWSAKNPYINVILGLMVGYVQIYNGIKPLL